MPILAIDYWVKKLLGVNVTGHVFWDPPHRDYW